VHVAKSEKELVLQALAFFYNLFEHGKSHINKAYVSVSYFRISFIGKGKILHYLIVAFPKVKIKVDEAQRINSREVEVPILAFWCAVCYSHAQIEKRSFDEIGLFSHLHFNNELIPFGILAIYVEDGVPATLGFALYIRVFDVYCLYWVRKLSFEESVEQSNKQVAVSFACERSFESPIERELSVATLRRKLGFVDNGLFWHNNTSFMVKMKPKQKCDIIKGGCEASCNKNWNIENCCYGEAA
jgi:hypothetical protein